MRRVLILGVIAAALSGCATPVEMAQGGDRWIRGDEPGEDAILRLGVPDSDNIAVTLSCKPGSGAVDISVNALSSDGAVVEFHAGKVWNRYGGSGHTDEELGDYVINLKLAAVDPVLQSFADTGQLTLVFPHRQDVLPNAFAPAHDFLAVCRLPK